MAEKFLLVASDVHSDSSVFEYLTQIAKDSDCLAFIYAGDLDVEDYFISSILRNRNFVFVPVQGNCDNPYSYTSSDIPVPGLYRTCTFNGLRIFVSHGHLYNMPCDVGLNDEDYDLVINGHTHIPANSRIGGIEVVNPGSAARPRGYSQKSYVKIMFTGQTHRIQFETIPDSPH